MQDTLESALDQEGLEEAADSELEKVLYEVTQGVIGKAPDVPEASLPVCHRPHSPHLLYFRVSEHQHLLPLPFYAFRQAKLEASSQ